MTPNPTRPSWMTDTAIRRLDTPGSASRTPRHRRTVPALILLAAMGAQSRPAVAAPTPLNAKVVWAGQRQALIVSDSALTLGSGDVIRFLLRDKAVAEGEIQSLPSPVIGLVRLRSLDPLKGIRKLDRLKLMVDRRSPQAPSLLRVGYPAGARSNLLFACEHAYPSGLDSLYRVQRLTEHRFLLVRNPDQVTDRPWSDTLLVRLFDDSGDEEIAFERGDLDVAMFWPGELSRHARDLWNMAGRVSAPRPRGWIAAMWLRADGRPDPVPITPADRIALHRFQEELFDTDLASEDTARFHPDSAWHTAARFEVDHALPGWQVIEGMLNTRPGTKATRPDSIRIWLFHVDAPVVVDGPHDDVGAIARAVAQRLRTAPVPQEFRVRADSLVLAADAMQSPAGQLEFRRILREQLNLRLYFVPYCPVLYRWGLEPVLMPLGSKLVNLIQCSPATDRP